jgi:hypothetical protein
LKQLFVDYRDAAAACPVAVARSGRGVDELGDRLDTYGFAIAEMPGNLSPQEAIDFLAESWSLGDPYVPALYRLPGAEQFNRPYADIRANDAGDHPGFAVRSAQEFHVDGTLDGPGDVPTVLMYCVRPAVRGGESLLLNSIGVFHALRETDPAAAAVLTRPTVLRRSSTLRGVEAHTDGPAFVVRDDGAIVNRYSDVPSTTTWIAPLGEEDALARALAFVRQEGSGDGRFRLSVRLQTGECLIVRNDRVSHARQSYEDSAAQPRQLLRATFGASPR